GGWAPGRRLGRVRAEPKAGPAFPPPVGPALGRPMAPGEVDPAPTPGTNKEIPSRVQPPTAIGGGTGGTGPTPRPGVAPPTWPAGIGPPMLPGAALGATEAPGQQLIKALSARHPHRRPPGAALRPPLRLPAHPA